MPYDAVASLPYIDIEKLKTGDPKSFQRLYQLFYGDLVNKATSLLKEKEAAATLVNHSFIKCWLRSGDLTSMDYITAFLTTTVRNNCTSCHNVNGFRSAHYSDILEVVLSESTRNGLTRKALLSSINAIAASEMNNAQLVFNLFYERHMAVPDITIETGKDSQTTGKALSTAFQALHLIICKEDI